MPGPIPFHDFGGNGPLIHLAHANGLPPACYRRMAAPLLSSHRVIGLHQRPLWPDEPPEDFTDWHVLGDDLIRFLDQRGLSGVIGVGHSVGGIATMYAAIERPDLFRALILIEPVLLPPPLIEVVRGLEPAAVAAHIPLIAQASGRRDHWPDRAAAFKHFRAKPVFERMSDRALEDYVSAALMPVEESEKGGFTLVCPPAWEARIYSTPPTDVWDLVGEITQPTLGMIGELTETPMNATWDLWRSRQPSTEFVSVPKAGHLLPLERHRRVGKTIRSFVSRTIGRAGA